jgi:hypothetical protein
LAVAPTLPALILRTPEGISSEAIYLPEALCRWDRKEADLVVGGGIRREDTFQRRRDLLLGTLRSAGFHCSTPQGAYYIMVNSPR